MGGTTAEKFIGQMIDKVADRSNVEGSVEAWDGGASGVVADYAEAFRLQNL